MVSPSRGAWRLTLWSYYETPVIVKLWVPPQQSWGVSRFTRAAAFHQQISDCLHELDKISLLRHSEAFSVTDFDDRIEVLNDFRSLHGSAIRRIASVAVQCYYLDDRVMTSLGMDARAPYPDGFEVEQGDWSLLDPVRQRSKLYRDVS
jgi:hypothetical protein